MIETYLLQNLVAFDECKTLVATSEKVNVSQPALTRSFQKLEDLLELPLFERTKNTIKLNQTGLMAVKFARRILNLQDEMQNALTDFYNRTREIKIASIAPAPLWKLTMLLEKSYPETKITSELLSENDTLFESLAKGKNQVVITTEFRADERFYSKEFFEEHLKVSVPKNHRLASKKSLTLKELAGETFVMLSDLGFWSHIKNNLIPNAKFITQNEISDLRDIVNNSTLLAFSTDYTEKLCDVPAYSPETRISIPISDDEVNVKFYAVCGIERMQELIEILR